MSIAIALHLLAALIWIGGMFFAHMVLRLAVETRDLEDKVHLWQEVLPRFFRWVWGAVVVLPLTGYWMAVTLYGNPFLATGSIRIMQVLGWSMILLFVGIYFTSYRSFQERMRQQLFPEAGLYLLRIRRVVTINLILGLLVAVIASAGRFL
ncbi:MAG: CopD family protein [Magnetococcales bacterium]|nr:CopD family protein [Magnetococcales bacterium]